jgi:hypothetical protein
MARRKVAKAPDEDSKIGMGEPASTGTPLPNLPIDWLELRHNLEEVRQTRSGAQRFSQTDSNVQHVGIIEVEATLMDRLAIIERHLLLLRDEVRSIGQTAGFSPEFYARFNAHSVHDQLSPPVSEPSPVRQDLIRDEIAREVQTFWADRNNAEYASEPWVRTPSSFIAHVYNRWFSAKTLARRHLNHDQKLYRAYSLDISRHPERDLHLETADRVRSNSDEERGKRVREKARIKMSQRRGASKPAP